jgi:hypothetical protein
LAREETRLPPIKSLVTEYIEKRGELEQGKITHKRYVSNVIALSLPDVDIEFDGSF